MKKPILKSLFPVALLALSLSVSPIAKGDITEPFTFNLGGLAIPDGTGTGVVNDQIPGTTIVTITGLTVTLNIAGDPNPGGGFNGDLFAYLRHTTPIGTGYTVLLNRVGKTAVNTFGYEDSGFNVTFDGVALAGDIHTYQSSAFNPYPGSLNGSGQLAGTWQPDARETDPATVVDTDARTATLSSFIGNNAKGTWTLYVEDLSAGVQMSITSWGLNITGIPSAEWYWKGATDNKWTTVAPTNWTLDAAGTMPAPVIPNFASDVIFSASGAINQNTDLGANFTIHTLTINDDAPVTINSGVGGPFTLTISGDPGTGIDVQAGAGLFTMNANLTLGGTSDTINVSNTDGAVINGVVGGTNGLIKTGTGTLTLTAANNYTGGTRLNAGTLLLADNNSLGGVAGGTLTINGGTIGTTVASVGPTNPVLVNADFSMTRVGAGNVFLFYAMDLGGGNRTITNLNGGDTVFGNVISNGTGLTLASVAGMPSTFEITAGGNNTYLGTTTLNGPTTLNLQRPPGTNSIPGDLTLNDNSKVNLNQNEQIIDTSNVTLNGTSRFSAPVTETIATLNGTSATTTVALSTAGALSLNSAANASYAGTITGAAGSSLTKNGTGTQTLTGPATTGTTTINAGTLAIDNDGATKLGSLLSNGVFVNGGAGAGENGGHLFFLNSASIIGSHTTQVSGPTFAGAGNGTVEFFNNSSSAAGAIVNHGGTVAGGTGGSTIFHDSSTAGTGTLGQGIVVALGSAVNGAIGGNIAFFDNSSAGAVTLNAAGGVDTDPDTGGRIFFFNNSSGGTSRVGVGGNAKVDISLHNTPGVGIGSLEGSGHVFLGANTLTVGGNNLDKTFSGVLQDGGTGGGTGGSLTKVGTGSFRLTGVNTYTGTTTVAAGTLQVGNAKALGSANLTMTGGTLQTTGPLVVDIGPGNILFTGGTYIANVGGATPGVTHDQLKTTGMASVTGGTIALAQQNGFTLAPGQQVVLASATGGVAGSSANGTSDPNVTGLSAFSTTPLLVPTVNLYPTSVVLEAMQGSFAALQGTLGFTPNQLSVATALDSVSAKIGGKTGVFSELTFLDTQSLTTLAGNLDKMAPDELTAMFTIAVSLANIQTDHIQGRTASIRDEAGGGAAAFKISENESPRPSDRGASGPVGKRSKEIRPADNERWGVWFTGAGEFTHVGSTTNAAGFNTETGGVTAGVDYRFTDHFAAGISLGYMNTTASLVNGGKVDVDGGRVGLYATWFDRGFYLDAAVSGGFNSYDTRRITPNNTAATGKTDGSEINTLLAAGYDWKFGGLTIGPTASFQYTNVDLDGFTENGAFAPLRIAGQDAESLRTALGVRATFDAHVGGVTIRPEVKAAWQHEYGDTTYTLTSNFATLGGNAFTVYGPTVGRDSMLISAGFTILWNPRFSTYAFYDGELFRTNYNSHNVSAGFRYRF